MKPFIPKPWQLPGLLDGSITLVMLPMNPQPIAFEESSKCFEGENNSGGMLVGPDSAPEGWVKHRWWHFDYETSAILELRRCRIKVTPARIRKQIRWWKNYQGTPKQSHGEVCILCPLGQVGGKVCVKEAFATELSERNSEQWVIYRSGMEARRSGYCHRKWPIEIKDWRSPATMPQRASRLTLEVTCVSVKRVQEVTEEEARAACADREEHWDYSSHEIERLGLSLGSHHKGRNGFMLRYNADHGPGAWGRNDWCWFVGVRRAG